MPQFTESVVEDASLLWLQGLGYAVLHGPEIAAGAPGAVVVAAVAVADDKRRRRK